MYKKGREWCMSIKNRFLFLVLLLAISKGILPAEISEHMQQEEKVGSDIEQKQQQLEQERVQKEQAQRELREAQKQEKEAQDKIDNLGYIGRNVSWFLGGYGDGRYELFTQRKRKSKRKPKDCSRENK